MRILRPLRFGGVLFSDRPAEPRLGELIDHRMKTINTAFQTALALTVSLFGLAGGAQAQTLYGVDGEVIGTEQQGPQALGGSYTNPWSRGNSASYKADRVFELTLTQTWP